MERQTERSDVRNGAPGIMSLLSTWASNFQRNTATAFAEMQPRDYIRLVVIIGAYCLLRPYLLKLTARAQAKDHERKMDSAAEPRRIKKVDIPGVDSDTEEDEAVPTAEWGKRARVRQRTMIKQRLEEHERRLREQQATESDKDIEEFLVDD